MLGSSQRSDIRKVVRHLDVRVSSPDRLMASAAGGRVPAGTAVNCMRAIQAGHWWSIRLMYQSYIKVTMIWPYRNLYQPNTYMIHT